MVLRVEVGHWRRAFEGPRSCCSLPSVMVPCLKINLSFLMLFLPRYCGFSDNKETTGLSKDTMALWLTLVAVLPTKSALPGEVGGCPVSKPAWASL